MKSMGRREEEEEEEREREIEEEETEALLSLYRTVWGRV